MFSKLLAERRSAEETRQMITDSAPAKAKAVKPKREKHKEKVQPSADERRDRVLWAGENSTVTIREPWNGRWMEPDEWGMRAELTRTPRKGCLVTIIVNADSFWMIIGNELDDNRTALFAFNDFRLMREAVMEVQEIIRARQPVQPKPPRDEQDAQS